LPPVPPRVVEAPRPKPVVVKRVVTREPPPEAPPPPPNQQPPAERPLEAPPVFGVTMDSTVSGGAGIAVPVGNTLMAKPSAAPRGPAAPQAYSGAAQADVFRPVADAYIAKQATVRREVNSADYYPPDALALGLEGAVTLSVGINERGTVVEVRVLKRAGHKFDEAAVRALRQFEFYPARTSDGRAVPTRITYSFKFTVSN
ncbi:MAG TPA: TonB family protein, partial [Polyangia bacterium]